MATINLLPNKSKRGSKKNNDIHAAVYNTYRWKRLRLNYLSIHPICECCDNALAIDVHHIKEISKGSSIEEYKLIGYDENNLMALCKECHKAKHNKN